jgi:hypothetical protein
MGKKNGLKKIITKTLTNKKLWTFEWPNLDIIFLSPYLGHFLLDWLFSPFNMYVKELCRWVAFHMDFISWLITTYGALKIDF